MKSNWCSNINVDTNGHLSFDTENRNTYWIKNICNSWWWPYYMARWRRMCIDQYFLPWQNSIPNGSKISNKTTNPKYDRKESMEQAWTHWHRKKTFKEACSTALRSTFNKWNHMKQTFFMVKEIISWEKASG